MEMHLESKKGKGRAQVMNFRVRVLSKWDWRSKWEADWGVNWEERGWRWDDGLWWCLRMAMALSTREEKCGEEREEKCEEEREWRRVLVRGFGMGMAVERWLCGD